VCYQRPQNYNELSNEDTSGLVHVIVTGEPLGEERVIEEKKFINRLEFLGVVNYRIHVGEPITLREFKHYYPYECLGLYQVSISLM